MLGHNSFAAMITPDSQSLARLPCPIHDDDSGRRRAENSATRWSRCSAQRVDHNRLLSAKTGASYIRWKCLHLLTIGRFELVAAHIRVITIEPGCCTFNDDFPHHFASLTHALRVVTSEDWALTATGVLCWSCVDDLDHDQRPTQGAQPPLRSMNTAGRHCFSDTSAPDRCCCASLPAATTHVLVPLVTLHPSRFRTARMRHHLLPRVPFRASRRRRRDGRAALRLAHSRAARRGRRPRTGR